MYSNILVPVDLAHASTLEKAIRVACDLGKLYQGSVFLVGVTSSAPGQVAHTPGEFAEKLAEFAAAKSAEQGITMVPVAEKSNDPAAELEDALKAACEEVNADLVVMASHVPGFRDHFFGSHAGHLASHAEISVLVVR